jgi:DNA mismatch repair protein MutL
MRAAWEAVATFALAHLDVGFELSVDAVGRMHVPAGQDRISRLASVWGHDLAATLIPVQHAGGAVLVEGLVQRPADARPTGRRAQLYVNGRPFRDHFLVRAAEAGYRSAIHPGDRPSLLLFLTVPGSDVDVNVHPAKLEVRFRERGVIEQAVEDAVRQALGSLEAATSVWGSGATPGRGLPFEIPPSPSSALPTDLFAPSAAPNGEEPPPQAGPRTLTAPMVQLFDTYIIFESLEGLVLVDQHSAHERVLYEQAMQELVNGEAASQRLLLPITVELTDEELSVVETFGDTLRRIGFEVEPFGGRSVVLHAVPAPHPRFDAAECFREMVSDLARGRFGGWANQLERFAATYACRAAVKAGARLGDAEMRALLLRLFETDLPPHDVHGRSTIVRLTREELERRFGRR